jgi:hypothetical protein
MQTSAIQENSYWLLDDQEEKIVAMCEFCAKKHQKGWFWDGKNLGYGDYDLFCNECGNAIYLRNNNDKTTDQNKPE